MPSPALLAAAEGLPPLFTLLALMLTAVVGVSLLLLRLQQSLLAGYFLCGVLLANSGVLDLLGGGETEASISQMSEFGVMLLMFTLGLEFSLGELRYLRRQAFVGGGWQMSSCMALAAASAWAFADLPWAGIVLLDRGQPEEFPGPRPRVESRCAHGAGGGHLSGSLHHRLLPFSAPAAERRRRCR
jgi:hypothetical protein